MERKGYILILIFSYILTLSYGQNNMSIYQAYIRGDMAKWKNIVDSMQTISEITNTDKLDLLNYQYGYIAYSIDKNKKKEAEWYLNAAEKLVQQLERKQYSLSVLYAYKSAFIGFKIGLSPYKAPFIGAGSLEYAEKSVDLDVTNSLGYIQLGNIAFYTPAMFGGSRDDALKHYLKALGLMEKDVSKLVSNWNYLNLLITIISAYYELEQYKMAEQYCIKTLKIEPGFTWVKNELYPKVLKKLNDE